MPAAETRFEHRSRATRFEIDGSVRFGPNVVFGPGCRRVTIGYGSFIGEDSFIDVPELDIGEYVKLHRGALVYGYQPLRMGHNCWVGQNTVIDSIGGTDIGNNVGIGAASQLWSHIKFGDTLEGCRWNGARRLVVEDDVWFVGHCIVSPIHAHRRSMLLAGGVVTRDMEENHVYAGVPAKDVTDRVGPQFAPVSVEEKLARFQAYYREFLAAQGLTPADFRATAVDDLGGRESTATETFFNLRDRTYRPARSKPEVAFMQYLLYDRAKFLPAGRESDEGR